MLIPSPKQLLTEFPHSQAQQNFVKTSRQHAIDILNGIDSKILVIVGPCSIHDKASTLEYAYKLKNLLCEIDSCFFPIMRVYFEKPRTTKGWKGFVSDPYLDGSCDIPTGIKLTRQLLLELTEMQIPIAAEFLEPASVGFFADLISWGCIGARTVESQVHRQIASLLPMPVAFKNSTSGNIDVAIHGIISASLPHIFIGPNHEGQQSILHSQGNSMGHLVLRGGESQINYDPESIDRALRALKKAGLPERILIDCSHDNSRRKYENQSEVFQSTINQIVEGNQNIRGLLLESHLHAGSQDLPKEPGSIKYGVSVTDSCLNFEMTASLLRWGALHLNANKQDAIQPFNECPTCA